jgi:hypothetical protein
MFGHYPVTPLTVPFWFMVILSFPFLITNVRTAVWRRIYCHNLTKWPVVNPYVKWHFILLYSILQRKIIFLLIFFIDVFKNRGQYCVLTIDVNVARLRTFSAKKTSNMLLFVYKRYHDLDYMKIQTLKYIVH